MGITIPVGPIALALIIWEICEYRDWIGATGTAVLYLGYWITAHLIRQIARSAAGENTKPEWWDEVLSGVPHPTDQSAEAKRIRRKWIFRWLVRPRFYPAD